MNNLSNIKTIKELLARHNFHFSKSMGQNFLINPSVCPKMAEYSILSKETTGVIEIGPGIGVLTCELAARAEKVVAIELDKMLLPVLDETLAAFDNIKIINSDVLKIDLAKLIKDEFDGLDVVVCANLPYYITSPVIMSLLESKLPIKSITVMVQKEAADRLCAKVGTRLSGAITVSVNYYAESEILFDVSKGSFMPSPNVDSSVIKLTVREKPSIAVSNEALLFKIIKASFGMRRKTIHNAISAGMGVSKDSLLEILNKANVSPTLRAEQLSMNDFEAITNCF